MRLATNLRLATQNSSRWADKSSRRFQNVWHNAYFTEYLIGLFRKLHINIWKLDNKSCLLLMEIDSGSIVSCDSCVCDCILVYCIDCNTCELAYRMPGLKITVQRGTWVV